MVTLEVEAWQCYGKGGIALGMEKPLNLLLAPNMEGKTALVDAVEFLFLGTAKLRGIPTKKELALLAIPDGCEITRVGLQVGPVTFVRTMNRRAEQKLTRRKARRAEEITTEEMLKGLKLDERKIRAVLDAESLFRLAEPERRALLFGAMGGGVTRERVRDALASLGLDGEDVEELATIAAASFRKAEEKAGDWRREAKRELQELGDRPEPRNPYHPTWSKQPIDLAAHPLDAFEARLEGFRTELSKGERAAGADLGAAAARVDELRRQHETMVQRGNEIMGGVDVTEAGARETRLVAAYGEMEQAWKAARDQVTELEKKLEGPGVGEPFTKPKTCPAVAGEMRCPAQPSTFQRHLEGLKTPSAQHYRDDLENLRPVLGRLAAQKAALEGDRNEAIAEATAARARRDAREQIHRDLDALEADLDRAQTEFLEIRAGQRSENALEELREKIKNGEQLVEVKRNYDEKVIRLATWAERYRAIKVQIDRADQLAQVLKPTGIESQILAELLGPLREGLAEIGRWVGEVTIDDELAISLAVGGGRRRYQQLSETGRMRLALAVQHALARLAGFPLLIFDRLDHLDPPGRNAALKALHAVAPQYRAVLALATLQKTKPEASGREGIDTWWLEKGELRKVTEIEDAFD